MVVLHGTGIKNNFSFQVAWPVRLIGYATLDLCVMSSSPTLGIGYTQDNFFTVYIWILRESVYTGGAERERDGKRILSRLYAAGARSPNSPTHEIMTS